MVDSLIMPCLHLQLDNQSTSAVFTTVLAPTPPPKSVAADSGNSSFL